MDGQDRKRPNHIARRAGPAVELVESIQLSFEISSVETDLTSFEIAGAHTLLGQLQRGLGRGYLSALTTPGADDLLLECIGTDPRWDRQIEERAAYYAVLGRKLSVPARAILEIVEGHDTTTGGFPGALAADVLAEMAARGDEDARAVTSVALRSPTCLTMLSAVVNVEYLYDLTLLSEIDLLAVANQLAERELEEAIVATGPERWEEVSRFVPRVEAIRGRRIEEIAQTRRELIAVKPDSRMSTTEILSHVGVHSFRQVVDLLALRTDPESVAIIIDTARSGDYYQAHGALTALGLQQNLEVLPEVTAALAQDTGTLTARRSSYLRYLNHLPSEVTLPLARDWMNVGGVRAVASQQILAIHATPEDRIRLESALATALDDGEIYRACSMIEGLEQIGDSRSAPVLVRTFKEISYSWARPRVLKALAASDCDAGRQLSAEALWDCDVEARAISVTMAPRTAELQARIREMAEDRFEDKLVRQAIEES